MTPHPTPIDISNNPDLIRLAEEVTITKQPRELKRNNKIVAILMPTEKKRTTSIQDALAGAWKALPSDDMEEQLSIIRHKSKSTSPFTLDEA